MAPQVICVSSMILVIDMKYLYIHIPKVGDEHNLFIQKLIEIVQKKEYVYFTFYLNF